MQFTVVCVEQGVCETDPNAVVVGLAPSDFYYEKLNEAFR